MSTTTKSVATSPNTKNDAPNNGKIPPSFGQGGSVQHSFGQTDSSPAPSSVASRTSSTPSSPHTPSLINRDFVIIESYLRSHNIEEVMKIIKSTNTLPCGTNAQGQNIFHVLMEVWKWYNDDTKFAAFYLIEHLMKSFPCEAVQKLINDVDGAGFSAESYARFVDTRIYKMLKDYTDGELYCDRPFVF